MPMLHGKQSRHYHTVMWHVNTGLAYDQFGDYRLTVRARRWWLRFARWIRCGKLPYETIWELAGACSRTLQETRQRRTEALAAVLVEADTVPESHARALSAVCCRCKFLHPDADCESCSA
jgi:N-glycosylase/DNA lyase